MDEQHFPSSSSFPIDSKTTTSTIIAQTTQDHLCYCLRHPNAPSSSSSSKSRHRRLQSQLSTIAILHLLVLLVSNVHIVAASSSSVNRRLTSSADGEDDPLARQRCQGELGLYGGCQCFETEIICINAQFIDTDIFLHVNNHYKYVRRVTFHGNNFVELPFTALFGESHIHERLELLNISANYIVKLHANALRGMPNLVTLDMSNNEIVLKDDDLAFLTHVPKLQQLYLRRAFNPSVNRTIQFDLMQRIFDTAHLDALTVLDLSYNYFHTLPYDIACSFRSLKHLDLRQNMLSTLSINVTCMPRIETLDLSRNHFHTLSMEFRRSIASALPDYSLVMRNSFYCDCTSHAYISWVRATTKVRDKDALTCARASPIEYVGTRLIDVPIDSLDCSVSLAINSANIDRDRSKTTMIIAIVTIAAARLLSMTR